MTEQPEQDRDRQRPYKIFISLLDKWEIGQTLTEVLVLDAFAALQKNLRPGDDHDEVRTPCLAGRLGADQGKQLLMTANVLFEAIDPFLLWKQLYTSIRSDFTSESDFQAGFLLLLPFQSYD